MVALGALAFILDDVATGSRPPIRPQRPARRTRHGAGIAGAIRLLRSHLTRGVAEADGLRPVTRNYPY